MEFIAEPWMMFIVDTWECFLLQILKDRVESCQMEEVVLLPVHLQAKDPMEDSMDDIVYFEDFGVHEGTLCD